MKVRINRIDCEFWQFDNPDYESYLDFLDELYDIDSIEFGYIKIIAPLNFFILPCTCKDHVPYSWYTILYENIMTSLGYSNTVTKSIISNTYRHNTRPMKNFTGDSGTSIVVEEFKRSITCRMIDNRVQ